MGSPAWREVLHTLVVMTGLLALTFIAIESA